MDKKLLILLAFVIPFLTIGAGCAKQNVDNQENIDNNTPSSTSTASPVTVTPTPSSDGTRALVATETDATWKLYTNNALGYTVNTPTKGKYAPTWEMKFFDQSDPHIINGCYFNKINPTPSNETVNDNVTVLDGTKFCHTRSRYFIDDEGSDPNNIGYTYVVDDYATALGKKFIVMEFTKLSVDASMIGCANKMTEAYSLSKTACIPFVAADYKTTLDGIVGTFQMNMMSNIPVTVADETSNWQTYTNDSLGISFKYPNNWFIYQRADGEQRIYISTVPGEVDKSTKPSDFKRVWISYDPAEANENRSPYTGAMKNAEVNNGISMNYYENQDPTGESWMDAYWINSNGVKYMATCASDVGLDDAKQEVAILRQILPTFKFTK